jgi:5-methylthioadenosine/S-adenosylhomocysteine deaminase
MDLLISGGTVVTMDAEHRGIEDGGVAIEGDTIVAVGKRTDLESQSNEARTIDASGTLVLPGLINGNAHAAMSLFRGIAEDHSLDDWLQRYIFPAEARNVTEDFVLWGTRVGLLEMLCGGVTTFAEMYYFEDVVARVTKEAGMRGILGETVLDFPAPENKNVTAALAYTETFIRRWKNDPLITPAVAPHSIYTLSEADLREAATLARREGAPIRAMLAATLANLMSASLVGIMLR